MAKITITLITILISLNTYATEYTNFIIKANSKYKKISTKEDINDYDFNLMDWSKVIYWEKDKKTKKVIKKYTLHEDPDDGMILDNPIFRATLKFKAERIKYDFSKYSEVKNGRRISKKSASQVIKTKSGICTELVKTWEYFISKEGAAGIKKKKVDVTLNGDLHEILCLKWKTYYYVCDNTEITPYSKEDMKSLYNFQ